MKVQFFFRFLLEGPFKIWLEVNKSGSNPRQLREEVLKMIIHIVYINNENRIIVSKHVSKRTTVIFVHIIQFPNSRIHKYLHWKFGKKVQQQFTLRHDFLKWRTRTVNCKTIRPPRFSSWWHLSPAPVTNNWVKTSRCICTFIIRERVKAESWKICRETPTIFKSWKAWK